MNDEGGSEEPQERPSEPDARERSRPPITPPMPFAPRAELALLDDHAGGLGGVLWRLLTDLLLWISVSPSHRTDLFEPSPWLRERVAALAVDYPDLRIPLLDLHQVVVLPELVDQHTLAKACETVQRWAEVAGLTETALQFAEAAARLECEVSKRCYVAGRLCRVVGDLPRASLWLRRAQYLARAAFRQNAIAPHQADFVKAQIAQGNLEYEQGDFQAAERHLLKAVRGAKRFGKQRLAASAYHDLMAVAYDSGRVSEAFEYAERAADTYPSKHPRFPKFVHDLGYMLLRVGHFAASLSIFQKVRPWIEKQPQSIIMYAAIARAAAAVDDLGTFSDCSLRVLRLAGMNVEAADSSLYHLAEGARSVGDCARAEALARRASALAESRGNEPLRPLLRDLLDSLQRRQLGDRAIVPPTLPSVDHLIARVLQQLDRYPAPEQASGAEFPEDYPHG